MRVQDLQLFLSNFTKGSDAVKNAVIYVEINGKLHAIRRMEVHENATPIIPSTVKLFRGSRIMELEACGFKLDACCLGLEACGLMLQELGA